MTPYIPLLVKCGDTYARALTVRDEAGTVVNLAGCTLAFHPREPGATAGVFPKALTVSVAANGVGVLTLTKAETAGLTPGLGYRDEVGLTDGAGGVSTVVGGALAVLADRG